MTTPYRTAAPHGAAELPSGLRGRLRQIKGTEIAAIAEANDSAAASASIFHTLLGNCWEATLDAGPYGHVQVGDGFKPDWNRVLKGDLLGGLIYLRQTSITDGDEFEFDVRCEECGHKIEWMVKLSEIPVKPLSEEGARRIKAGEPLETTLNGVRIRYNLQTLAQEELVTRFMKQQRRKSATIIDALCAQITFIEGALRSADSSVTDIKSRWEWLSERSMGELYDLREALEEHDCGYQTSIEVVCTDSNCRWEQEVNLPLLNRRFFSPKRKKRLAGSARSASSAASSVASTASSGGTSAPTSGGVSTEEAATP